MAILPTRVFAGVEVPNTTLITKALALCRKHLNDLAYNHTVRTWLFGFIIAAKIPELQGRDLEAHAIAAILHDLGWDETGDLVTQDKRFEVDGANAAREFLRREAGDWDKHRIQLVWDAIALHTTTSIAWHKEPEVVATSYGITADFTGPDGAIGGHLTWEAWNVVVKELPRLGMKEGVREICCRLCRTKPETTYDNFVGQYGERYVEGYTLAGKKSIDFMEASTLG
ncbi:MAG: hypothetical protein ALECFALPRED_007849 [Alectoria fallacina]|uniref:HD domain-containing protein n=1 Tax=Alectoria fallacina TaxID=1903189 RepID=A0A8H3J1B3_9LECA|nr:MAG: hypothetical protein ALECFALPRED_007849 [Alectoria fallacina]